MRQQVNLYQPIFRKQEKKFSATAMLQSIAAVFVALLLLFAWTQWQVIQLKSELARTDQKQAISSKRLNEVMQQFGGRAATSQTADEEIARLEQRIAEQQRIRDILGRGYFSNTQGFSDYLLALARQNVPGVWLTGFDIVGAAEQISLQGHSINADAVPRYVQKLSKESRLGGIEFDAFQIMRAEAADKKHSDGTVTFTIRTAGAPVRKAP